MPTKLVSLTKRSRDNSLYRHVSLMPLFTEQYLLKCFAEVKKEKLVGLEKTAVKEYQADLRARIKDLAGRIKRGKYRTRPIEDVIVRRAVQKIIEAVFEDGFGTKNYGPRPDNNFSRSWSEADAALLSKSAHHSGKLETAKTLGNIRHYWVMQSLRQRIGDENFLRLVSKLLKADGLEKELSRLLARIYFNFIIDLNVERFSCFLRFSPWPGVKKYCFTNPGIRGKEGIK